MPNQLAVLMLWVWPAVTFGIFLILPKQRAIVWSILLGYLFLPPDIAHLKFPSMPPLDKDNWPSIWTAAMFIVFYGIPKDVIPKNWLARALLVVYIFSPVLTALANSDDIRFGRAFIPGLSLRDAFAVVADQFLFALPLLIAHSALSDKNGLRELVRGIVGATLIYTPLMLIEVRLSPQLNLWVYGFFQHSFEQMMRSGGFRPMVFLYHGLWVAMLASMAIMGLAGLYRSEPAGRRKWVMGGALVYLLAVLVLCKSLGALILAVIALPVIIFARRWMVAGFVGSVAVFLLVYPILKGNDVISTKTLVNTVAVISEERASSLEFRLVNEDIFLLHAKQRPWLGWGNYNRNRELDPISGQALNITDGQWVITISQFGWVGFIGEFLLLLLPLFLLTPHVLKSNEYSIPSFVLAAMVMLALNVVDLLPNATLTQLTFLLSGALLGFHANLPKRRVFDPNHSPLMIRPVMQG